MSNQNLAIQLDELEKQIRFLVYHNGKLNEELKLAKTEIEKLKSVSEEQLKTIEELESRQSVNVLAGSLVNQSSNSAELKAKIDEYIKEIDNCIAFLNKQL